MNNSISADFPFKSKFTEVRGSKIHYIDEGTGDPVLFLHGNPTSSYLWRNVIPYLTGNARCIAPDLIGMGKSDKPDISYSFFDHYEYLKAFIEKLELKNITLVIHDWGSGLGFHYANEHRENIKGIAFMEAIIKTAKWKNIPKDMKMAFKMMRAPLMGWLLVNVGNMFVKKMLPNMIIRKLSNEEMEVYKAPYPTIGSRKPLRVWPGQIPFDGKPKNMHDVVESYYNWLKETAIPKLCFYAEPGVIIPKESVPWIENNFPNTETVFLGKGLHFIQEDHPHTIGQELKKWYNKLSSLEQ